MRFLFTPALLAVVACGRAGTTTPEPVRCSPAVPRTAQHPISVPPSALGGEYKLIQVQTQPTSDLITEGRLHLHPLDSSAKARTMGGAVRDLVGWLELPEGDSAWRAAVASRDPVRPGVVLAGQHLRLGPGSSSGLTQHLEIMAVAANGFWGWWRADQGLTLTESDGRRVLPDPAGYFCAFRLDR
ncbi:MAG TPA: hypothetical protein VJ808_05735 [Gemmatimonadales bacterium]|nr:hypothetical protein [Gemmatimonadales bacterium]